MTDQITHRHVTTNGIGLHIAEMGQGPLVLMCHGFPESWYSWRHQIKAVANAGFRAVAPDMRGYGRSDKPCEIGAYNQVEVAKDIIGLISALGYEHAVVFGHDWGAPTAWLCAQMYPEKVSAVGALSNPFLPRSAEPPMKLMEKAFAGLFFYQLYYQTPGIAEAEWESELKSNLRKFYYLGSGVFERGEFLKPKVTGTDFFSDVEDPGVVGDWLTNDDLDVYVEAFKRGGFHGPVNYYRNMDLTWELTAGVSQTVLQPALFIAGDRETVLTLTGDAYTNMPSHVLDLRINQLLPDIGHWTQQEAAEEVSGLMIDFLHNVH